MFVVKCNPSALCCVYLLPRLCEFLLQLSLIHSTSYAQRLLLPSGIIRPNTSRTLISNLDGLKCLLKTILLLLTFDCVPFSLNSVLVFCANALYERCGVVISHASLQRERFLLLLSKENKKTGNLRGFFTREEVSLQRKSFQRKRFLLLLSEEKKKTVNL